MGEEELKTLIRNYEARYIWYKQQMEYIGKNRDIFPPNDDLALWYKALVREMKNASEVANNALIEELKSIRQGCNPPFCYHKKNQQPQQ